MTVFIVTVVTPTDGRYIDSIWVVHQHAVDRIRDLKAELQRVGRSVDPPASNAWRVYFSEGRVTDARLGDEPEPEDEETN